MIAVTVHCPPRIPTLTTAPRTGRSIGSFQNTHIIYSTSLRICRDSSFKLRCIRKDSNQKSSQVHKLIPSLSLRLHSNRAIISSVQYSDNSRLIAASQIHIEHGYFRVLDPKRPKSLKIRVKIVVTGSFFSLHVFQSLSELLAGMRSDIHLNLISITHIICLSAFLMINLSSINGVNCNLWQGFSVLKTDLQSDNGSTWSTMAFYVFSIHIPLSFGGLSIVAQLLHQTHLDPQTQALSLLLIQTLELVAFMLLLQFSEKPFNIFSFFETRVLPKERNWLLASVLGLGFLLAFVFLTSFVADKIIGPKDVNNPILKEILSGGSLTVLWSTLVYCFVTPVLEETVYRGFLLTSLASRMEWKKAVVISSVVFSATHLSVDNFLQLCVVGSVLGCSYCWSGTLISPFVIHSLYNALILVITFTS